MVDGVMIRTRIIIQLNNMSIVTKVFKLQFLGYFYIFFITSVHACTCGGWVCGGGGVSRITFKSPVLSLYLCPRDQISGHQT